MTKKMSSPDLGFDVNEPPWAPNLRHPREEVVEPFKFFPRNPMSTMQFRILDLSATVNTEAHHFSHDHAIPHLRVRVHVATRIGRFTDVYTGYEGVRRRASGTSYVHLEADGNSRAPSPRGCLPELYRPGTYNFIVTISPLAFCPRVLFRARHPRRSTSARLLHEHVTKALIKYGETHGHRGKVYPRSILPKPASPLPGLPRLAYTPRLHPARHSTVRQTVTL